MKISTDQEKKWETMWKKWENPLPQDSNDDIFADMEAAVSNWKELVQKEFKGTLGAIHKEEFDNAIETVLDGEDPYSKKKFWDNCVTFERFLDTIRYVVQNDFHKFNESKLNEYYHTSVAGDQRDIDDDNPRKPASPWERDPDYMHLNSSAMDRIVALNVTPGDKEVGNILFINRPKKLFCFNNAGYYKDTDPFLPVSRKTPEELQKFLDSPEMKSMKQVFYGKKLSDFKIKLVTFDTFIHKFQYKKGATLEKNIAELGESTVNETSFDQLDWKNGSLTGNGLKQAVDMYKAQDADKQTAVIYDRKSGKTFNIVDVNMGSIKSGHGLEIDIDTSKAIQKESEDMKDNKEVNEATNEDGKEYATISELLYAAHKAVPNSSDAGKHTEIFAVIDGKLELMKVGKFLKAKSWSDAGRFVLTDGSSTSKAAIDKLAKQLHLDESELNEADDNDPLSHALDAVGVKASTANSKSQDEVQMTATDGDTYAGIDVAIDKDIDAAMKEIYC